MIVQSGLNTGHLVNELCPDPLQSVNFIFILELRPVLSRFPGNDDLTLISSHLVGIIEVIALQAHVDADAGIRLFLLAILTLVSLLIILVVVRSSLQFASQSSGCLSLPTEKLCGTICLRWIVV